MALYFDERVEEEQAVADPEKDTMTMSLQMNIDIPALDEDDPELIFFIGKSFKTICGVKSLKWYIFCFEESILIYADQNSMEFSPGIHEAKRLQNARCDFSYKLFSDDEMRSEIYSSERISLTSAPDSDSFRTPAGSMQEFSTAYAQRKVAQMVIFFDLELPMKYFFRPFEISWIGINRKLCEDYPEDLTTDFRFEFLIESDFTFKCPDGDVPAMKMVLNVSSSFMKEYLNESKNDEFVIDHDVDFVEPVITYLHSRCFEMPKSYNLDFVDRLLKAIDFFVPEMKEPVSPDNPMYPMISVVYYSLCEKFVQDPHDFETILKWISLASRHNLFMLKEMIVVVIAEKYFYQFFEAFPEETRTQENQMLRDTFGTGKRALRIFKEITNIYLYLFFKVLT